MWRKLKNYPHLSGSKFKRQQAGHNLKLSKKSKRFFGRNRWFYSVELKKRIFRRFLLQEMGSMTNTSLHQNPTFFSFGSHQIIRTKKMDQTMNPINTLNEKVSLNYAKLQHWRQPYLSFKPTFLRSLLSSSFWVFQNPTAVPGAVRVQRARFLFRRNQRAIRTLNNWLYRIQQKWLSKLYLSLLSNKQNMNAWSFIQGLESYWPTILLKVGWVPTMSYSRQTLSQKKIWVNGMCIDKTWTTATPGDLFSYQNQVYSEKKQVKMGIFYSSFHKKILRGFHTNNFSK